MRQDTRFRKQTNRFGQEIKEFRGFLPVLLPVRRGAPASCDTVRRRDGDSSQNLLLTNAKGKLILKIVL